MEKMNRSDLVELCARASHEALRNYCMMVMEPSPPVWDKAPDWQKESARHLAKGVFDGECGNPETLHVYWTRHMAEQGWTLGEVTDEEKKVHAGLLSYRELTLAQRLKACVVLSTMRGVGWSIEMVD